MNPPTAVILGASARRHKFGNKAVRAFLRSGYTVIPVNPRDTQIEELAVIASAATIKVPVAVLSVYLSPAITLGLIADIHACSPDEVWLNPGAASPDLVAALQDHGHTVLELCSIRHLGHRPSDFSG